MTPSFPGAWDGEAGLVNAVIRVEVDGDYQGSGLPGWSNGQPYLFSVKNRTIKPARARLETSDGLYETATPGKQAVDVTLEGYFKGENYPPIGMQSSPYIRLTANTIFVFDGILLVTTFGMTGDEDDPLKWTIEGRSVGYYEFEDQFN